MRVGLFMSDTGGGHRAAARAIEAALHLRYPGSFTCEYFDVFRTCGLWPVNYAPEIYPRWVNLHSRSYDVFVALADRVMATSLGRRGLPTLAALNRRPYARRLAAWDILVVLHAAFPGFALAARERLRKRIPVLVVVTDMADPHSGWFHPGVDLCLVPTDSAYRRALELGVAPEKVRVVGHPAHPKFALCSLTRDQARQELGWSGDLPAVLVVSGAEGMGGMVELARAVDGLGAQLAIVAGRNQALAQALREIPWKGSVHVYGFVENMEILMRAADVLIGKPGPGVIAEAAIMGLPMILIGGMVNELPNARLVEEAGAGVYARTSAEAAQSLRGWLSSPEELARRAENAKAMAFPDASFRIAEEIAALCRINPAAAEDVPEAPPKKAC